MSRTGFAAAGSANACCGVSRRSHPRRTAACYLRLSVDTEMKRAKAFYERLGIAWSSYEQIAEDHRRRLLRPCRCAR